MPKEQPDFINRSPESEKKSSTPSSEEVWRRIATPEKKANIVKGVVDMAMSMGLTPDEAGELFSTLDNSTANGIGYLFGGVADGETVRLVGKALIKEDKSKKQ